MGRVWFRLGHRSLRRSLGEFGRLGVLLRLSCRLLGLLGFRLGLGMLVLGIVLGPGTSWGWIGRGGSLAVAMIFHLFLEALLS